MNGALFLFGCLLVTGVSLITLSLLTERTQTNGKKTRN